MEIKYSYRYFFQPVKMIINTSLPLFLSVSVFSSDIKFVINPTSSDILYFILA